MDYLIVCLISIVSTFIGGLIYYLCIRKDPPDDFEYKKLIKEKIEDLKKRISRLEFLVTGVYPDAWPSPKSGLQSKVADLRYEVSEISILCDALRKEHFKCPICLDGNKLPKDAVYCGQCGAKAAKKKKA